MEAVTVNSNTTQVGVRARKIIQSTTPDVNLTP